MDCLVLCYLLVIIHPFISSNYFLAISDDDGNGVMKYAKKMRKEGGEEVLEGVSSPVESLKSLGETQENQLVDVNEASKIPTEDLFSLVPISISTSEFYSSNEEQDYSKFLSAPILHDAGIVSERTPDLTPGPKLPEGLPPSATDLTNASIRLQLLLKPLREVAFKVKGRHFVCKLTNFGLKVALSSI